MFRYVVDIFYIGFKNILALFYISFRVRSHFGSRPRLARPCQNAVAILAQSGWWRGACASGARGGGRRRRGAMVKYDEQSMEKRDEELSWADVGAGSRGGDGGVRRAVDGEAQRGALVGGRERDGEVRRAVVGEAQRGALVAKYDEQSMVKRDEELSWADVGAGSRGGDGEVRRAVDGEAQRGALVGGRGRDGEVRRAEPVEEPVGVEEPIQQEQ